VLDQLGLNIVDARITPTGDGFSLDLYHVLEDDGAGVTDHDRRIEIEQALWRSVQGPEDAPLSVSRRAPRQARMFNTPTQIALSIDERNRRSVLELTAGDRPGLLCDVGKVLLEERVELHAAKIMTVGERAEDVFYLTDFDNRPLGNAAGEQLRERMIAALDRESQALRGGAARR
jgi:[protein-PII] uridylyltransferase